jgi:hypothetical protein
MTETACVAKPAGATDRSGIQCRRAREAAACSIYNPLPIHVRLMNGRESARLPAGSGLHQSDQDCQPECQCCQARQAAPGFNPAVRGRQQLVRFTIPLLIHVTDVGAITDSARPASRGSLQ